MFIAIENEEIFQIWKGKEGEYTRAFSSAIKNLFA